MAAFGKRSKLDKELKRGFIENKSEYVGVKYHIQYDFPKDKIAWVQVAGEDRQTQAFESPELLSILRTQTSQCGEQLSLLHQTLRRNYKNYRKNDSS